MPLPVKRSNMVGGVGASGFRSGHGDFGNDIGLLTIPDKPQSKNQKMRITAKGRSRLIV